MPRDHEADSASPHLKQRVLLAALTHEGEHPGEIVEVHEPFAPGLQPEVTVKLDRQEKPVTRVLYFDHDPKDEELPASHWQVCWPAYVEEPEQK